MRWKLVYVAPVKSAPMFTYSQKIAFFTNYYVSHRTSVFSKTITDFRTALLEQKKFHFKKKRFHRDKVNMQILQVCAQ